MPQLRQLKSIVIKPSALNRLKFLDKEKLSIAKGQTFNRLQFPKVDEDLIPIGKRRVANVNVEEGVSSLRVTIQDDKQIRPHRMIKPKTEVKKGQWFLNKYAKKEKQQLSMLATLARTQKG